MTLAVSPQIFFLMLMAALAGVEVETVLVFPHRVFRESKTDKLLSTVHFSANWQIAVRAETDARLCESVPH